MQPITPRPSADGAPVIVIGAGIGGLCAALRLATQGREVLILERRDQPGGKMRRVSIDGHAMDAGPTVFTMRWVFDELFAAAGTRLDDHLRLTPLTVLARHAWDSDRFFDLFADSRQTADAVGRFAGSSAVRGYQDFCVRAGEIYRLLEAPFLRDSRPNPASLVRRVGLAGVPSLMRISPFTTLWRELGTYFEDPRLRQLFGRYATYCGTSPFVAPATLMLVAHVEQDGVWSVEGGLHQVASCTARLAANRGVRFRYGAHVEQIVTRDDQVIGVRTADGEQIGASAVVFNGDVAALAGGLLGNQVAGAVAPSTRSQRSLSALTWNVYATTRGFPLLRHSVFFSGDYAREFDDIQRRSRPPDSPTVYVCAQDRGDRDIGDPGDRDRSADHKADCKADPRADHSRSTPAPERLLCIVNAPANGDTRQPRPEELAQWEHQAFQQLARCGLQIDRTRHNTVMTTPADFESLFPGTGGALYGQASQGWLASFRRPQARSRIAGLYLAGGSTHPGPGVPMAALSGRQAAISLLADQTRRNRRVTASIGRSSPAVTPGGTSTP